MFSRKRFVDRHPSNAWLCESESLCRDCGAFKHSEGICMDCENSPMIILLALARLPFEVARRMPGLLLRMVMKRGTP